MAYFYDIECYPNFFQIKLIPSSVSKKAVKDYIKADIAGDVDLLEEETKLGVIKFAVVEIDGKIIKNNLIEFYKFVKNEEGATLIGYNNTRYDDVMIRFLIGYKNVISPFGLFTHNRKSMFITEKLYQFSQQLIDKETVSPVYTDVVLRNTKLPFLSIDVLAYALESVEKKSLKQLEIMLNWHNVQELPYPFDRRLTLEQIRDVDIYNTNDVLATRHAFDHTKEELDIRIEGMRKYGVNIINATRSKIADMVIGDMYCKQSGMKFYEYNKLRTIRYSIMVSDILLPIKFETKVLQDLVDKVKPLNVITSKINENFIIDDVKYNFKLGGLHSDDRGILLSEAEYLLLDVDGTSYYPTFVMNNEFYPEHLNKAILGNIAKLLVSDRILAKRQGSKVAEVLKITINTGFFGKYGDVDSPLCDFKAKYSVTLNGQLMLLKLIEMQHLKGIKVFSANTDGVTFKVKPEQLDMFQSICREWETLTNVNLEETYYEKYVRRDVNNYLAVIKGFSLLVNTLREERGDGIKLMIQNKLGTEEHLNTLNTKELIKIVEKKYIKAKGCFRLTQDIRKGYNCTVVAKALFNYFIYNIRPEDYIPTNDNIYDFMMSRKNDRSFKVVYETVKDGEVVTIPMQNAIRYYATTKNGTIVKLRNTSRLNLSVSTSLMPFNKYVYHKNFKDYKVNTNYYVGEAYKIINTVLNLEYKKQKNYAYNGLFDFE